MGRRRNLVEGAQEGQALLLEKKKWMKRGNSFGEMEMSKVLQLYKRSSRIIILLNNISCIDKEEGALITDMNKFFHRLSGRSESQVIESWRQSRGKISGFCCSSGGLIRSGGVVQTVISSIGPLHRTNLSTTQSLSTLLTQNKHNLQHFQS